MNYARAVSNSPIRNAAVVGLLLLSLDVHAQKSGSSMESMPANHQMPTSEMGSMDHSEMAMLGSYAMSREASGTSWQPEATPMGGMSYTAGSWNLMTHGSVNAVYSDADGPRGDDDFFGETMFMVMGHRPAGSGMLGFRTMLSLEPWTAGDTGYPLLFQTGETADGQTPLIDRQHPHDLLMEMAATYSQPVGKDQSIFIYGGLPGEPALGPAAYMHRFSGMDNPEAPLGHHWLDATHITFGVVTLGYIWDRLKIEGSAFNGREPDQIRTNIDTGPLKSWSTRVTFNPDKNWTMQVSYGDLHSPEQLEPDMDMQRTTASVSYQAPLVSGQWQTTAAFGRNQMSDGPTTDAYLLESAWIFMQMNTIYGRLERVEKDELFEAPSPLAGQVFTVNKATIGMIRDLVHSDAGKFGIGAQYSIHTIPDAIEPAYGDNPDSWLVFARWRM